MKKKKTVLHSAVAAALGLAAFPVSATMIDAEWTGYFTFIRANGSVFQNTAPGASAPTYYGFRTPIYGGISINTATGTGTATVAPFSFSSGGLFQISSFTLQAIGNGDCTSTGCNPGSLILGNMGFNWGPNTGIPISIVFDAQGFINALSDGVTPGEVIDDVGVYAASENTRMAGVLFSSSIVMPMGLMPMATTEWNLTPTGNTSGCTWTACNPSGMLPLVTDTVTDSWEDTSYLSGDKMGVGGSPILSNNLGGYNANLDVDTMYIVTYTPDTVVPLPAAVWLFGSGLLGLASVVRRKKKV